MAVLVYVTFVLNLLPNRDGDPNPNPNTNANDEGERNTELQVILRCQAARRRELRCRSVAERREAELLRVQMERDIAHLDGLIYKLKCCVRIYNVYRTIIVPLTSR